MKSLTRALYYLTLPLFFTAALAASAAHAQKSLDAMNARTHTAPGQAYIDAYYNPVYNSWFSTYSLMTFYSNNTVTTSHGLSGEWQNLGKGNYRIKFGRESHDLFESATNENLSDPVTKKLVLVRINHN